MDREKIIKDLEFCVNGHFKVELSLATKILALLKEQKEKMEHLNNITLEYEKEVFRLQTLLKEQEAKTGHWIYKKYDDMFMCSCCEKYSIRNDYPYCHWCGAKMEGR